MTRNFHFGLETITRVTAIASIATKLLQRVAGSCAVLQKQLPTAN